MGLVSAINPRDLENYWTVLFWDADLAGSDGTTKSTAGGLLFVVGEHGTRFLPDGLSKLIGATSFSTPAAELCSGAMSLARLAFLLLQMPEEIAGGSIDLVALTDNSTALLDIQTGYAKAMRYLKRQHRISAGMLSKSFGRPGHVLAKTASGENTSDALTKPLGPEVHERHARGITLDLSFSSDVLTPEGR